MLDRITNLGRYIGKAGRYDVLGSSEFCCGLGDCGCNIYYGLYDIDWTKDRNVEGVTINNCIIVLYAPTLFLNWMR